MNTGEELRSSELEQVTGGRVGPIGHPLNVFDAAKWLLEPEQFWQLSFEDQDALKEHATEEIWLENFLYKGAKAGIKLFLDAMKVGRGISL